MQREITRTMQSLTRAYQAGCADLEYEVLLIDNGSPVRMAQADIETNGPEFQYHYLQDPSPSPAYAINYGVAQSSGDVLCFMIDGAHLLTPGVFSSALACFRTFDQPVAMTRYFYLGPDDQNTSIQNGYDKAVEDALLQQIDWPNRGYDLFEIGTPLQGDVPRITWLNKMTESNCLFMNRTVFEAIGGADEQFDLPGGGFLNLDFYKRAADLPYTQPVLLIGEGSFHQLHGGTTTNVSPEERDRNTERYKRQYAEIRGVEFEASDSEVYYFGHQPTYHSKIHLHHNRGDGPRATQALLESVRQSGR
jgi:glycosyltransferase involved in cell wall biosynthesis